MEIGGFITSGAEIVNHDNTLSGNGTVDSPLGLNGFSVWQDVTSAVSSTSVVDGLDISLSYNEQLKLAILQGSMHVNNGSTNAACLSVPSALMPLHNFEIFNLNSKYLIFNSTGTTLCHARESNGSWFTINVIYPCKG